ncbi:TRAP transporter small permease [Polyangium spumosum]|uniref:TRAP transporter small permease subunit n=1 Tax=Polyangium spumosum TaxID=889282 RepID=A0A6N7PNJ8_9BACT|nr:TRAP transporter small permease subunit [Polyangium spumosum]MRG93583.1 TRAP transporter small permease subunit [Polyangium spumosum]
MAGERDEEKDPVEAEEPSEAEPSASTKDDEPQATTSREEGAKTSAEPPRAGAAWATPFVRLERALTWFESRLLFLVLLALVFALVAWISLRGLASPVQADNAAGTVFRALLGAALLGALARFGTSRARIDDEKRRAIVTVVAMAIGVAIAPAWREVGVDRFDAILNWLQEGSSLTLFGGLRGVATRLTLLVALIGASLAAARSKHINIDVVLRFMQPKLRPFVHVAGALATAAVCFTAGFGFFDYVSIEGFGQPKEAPLAEKIAGVRRASSLHFFVLRKQVALDLRAMPEVVFKGVRWDTPSRMNGRAWNTWLDEAGFGERFTAEELVMMKAPPEAEEQPRIAVVNLPGESARGLLIHDMNLMWLVGLWMIGLRVLLRALLVASGHASVEPDAEEPDEDDEPTAPAAAGEGAR